MNTIKRWYYLLFHKEKCIHVIFSERWAAYGNVIRFNRSEEKYKYLGKSWMVKLKK